MPCFLPRVLGLRHEIVIPRATIAAYHEGSYSSFQALSSEGILEDPDATWLLGLLVSGFIVPGHAALEDVTWWLDLLVSGFIIPGHATFEDITWWLGLLFSGFIIPGHAAFEDITWWLGPLVSGFIIPRHAALDRKMPID
ncbi:hypothetical protein C8R44DRAFT_878227 [Mycena epipterygia]|nr:hypothetical protein C8R44DRAFT_878227 [Mycena epipterygia]